MWQPQQDGWGQWPIQQSAYANVPVDQVDWATLAKQWIAHKETSDPHIPIGHGSGDMNVHHGHLSGYPSWGWNVPAQHVGADWSINGGSNSTAWPHQSPAVSANSEAALPPPLPQYVDYGHGNYEVQGFDYNHGGVPPPAPSQSNWDYQVSGVSGSASHHYWPPEPLPPPPPPPPEDDKEEEEQHVMSLPLLPAPGSNYAVPGSTSVRSHHKRPSLHHGPPVASSTVLSEPEDMSSLLDAAKRKTLPSWIREGLEKMEREKLKKLEREKQEKEREEKEKARAAAEQAALEALGSQQSGEPTLPRKSRFDSDEENEAGAATKEKKSILPDKALVTVDGGSQAEPTASSLSVTEVQLLPVAPVTPSIEDRLSPKEPSNPSKKAEDEEEEEEEEVLSAEEKQKQLIEKVKEMLTVVLRDVTDEQIRIVAKETYAKCRQLANKAPAKQLAKSSALASLTAFGGDDDSDDSGSSDRSGDDRWGRRRPGGRTSDSDDGDLVDSRLRKKKMDFHKAQRERLLRLDREEQQIHDLYAAPAKERYSFERKHESILGLDETLEPGKVEARSKPAEDNLVKVMAVSAPESLLSQTAAPHMLADRREGLLEDMTPSKDSEEKHKRNQQIDSEGEAKDRRHSKAGGKALPGDSIGGHREGKLAERSQKHTGDSDGERVRRRSKDVPRKDRSDGKDNREEPRSKERDRVRSSDKERSARSKRNRDPHPRASPAEKHSRKRSSSNTGKEGRNSEQNNSKQAEPRHESSVDNKQQPQALSKSCADISERPTRSHKKEHTPRRRDTSSADSNDTSTSSSGSDSDSSGENELPSSRDESERARKRGTRGVARHHLDDQSHSDRSYSSGSNRKSIAADKSPKKKERGRHGVTVRSRRGARSSSRDSSHRRRHRREYDAGHQQRSDKSSRSTRRRSRSSGDLESSFSRSKRRDLSDDRNSKRKRRDASTSGSEERGGKKASRKMSRSRRRSRS